MMLNLAMARLPRGSRPGTVTPLVSEPDLRRIFGFGAVDPFGDRYPCGMFRVNREGLMTTAIRKTWIKIFDERGASMVEYAPLIALIALVVIAGAAALGIAMGDRYNEFGSTVQNA